MANSITSYSSEYIASLSSALSKYSPLEHLPVDQSNLYTLFEASRLALTPVNLYAGAMKRTLASPFLPMNLFPPTRKLAAGFEMLERLTWEYPRPEYGIEETEIEGKTYAVRHSQIEEKPFCRLLHFKKANFTKKQQKMLIVAPLSGHFATLCRGTIEALLPHFDVYITDWKNARNIPQNEGSFDLDDYTNYITHYCKILGKDDDLNIMAVCQPCVPVFASIALMHSSNEKHLPKSCILIGGPIDVRNNPTSVNDVALERSFNWFSSNVITKVPANCAGRGRKVYPGFLQLAGFMTMNLQRHIKSHQDLYEHLQEGNDENAEYLKNFYNEYLAVMDIPAEFYLQTLRVVFQEYHLPEGKMKVNGKLVKPEDITKTKMMVIEGERDDITGQHQTQAALDLCKNLPSEAKEYLWQEGVGHYGSFTGSKFRKFITPKIVKFCEKAFKPEVKKVVKKEAEKKEKPTSKVSGVSNNKAKASTKQDVKKEAKSIKPLPEPKPRPSPEAKAKANNKKPPQKLKQVKK